MGRYIGIGISAVRSLQSYWTPQYKAVLAAMTNKPSNEYSVAANTFVKSLVDGGVWSKLDFLYCFNTVTNDGGEALLNWINPGTYDATLAFGVGGSVPVFTSMQGFTGNIANKSYISTNFNPSTAGGKYARNSASMGCYVSIVGATLTQNLLMGLADGNLFLAPKHSGLFRGSLNSSADFAQLTKNTTPGLVSVVRPDSTHICIYKDKTELNNRVVNSAAINSGTITILKVNTLYEDSQVSMAFMGASLTAEDMGVLYDAYAFFLT